jgi:Anti-sigma-D factor RsdA to sigma factor binding region
VRSGDIGDEAERSADDAELPLDLAAVRADDDLIEALSAGLVPPPSGPRDPSDVEGELVALLAGWVADVRPESLLHPPGSQPVAVKLITASAAGQAEEDEPLAAVGSPAPTRSLLEYEDAEPVTITRRRPHGTRGYLLRAAAGLVAIALIGSGVIVRSYDAHPGDSLWVVATVVFPEKSRSVEAATAVSTALNTARVALESGRIDDARAAFQTVQDRLAAVDDADGRVELAHQRDYLTAQLSSPAQAAVEQAAAPSAGAPLATGQAGATIPSSPAVTPGAVQALLTPTSSPSVLAAPSGDPAATASGAGSSAPAVGGSSAPAVVAAPPDDPAVSAPPVVSNPAPSDAASGSSAGSPPAASPPPADPVIDPPVSTPSPEPPAPTSAPADPAATVQSTPDPPVDNGGSGGGGDSSANSVASDPADPPSGGSSSGSGDSTDNSGGGASNKSSDESSENSSSSSSGGGGSDDGQESSKSGGDGSGETAAAAGAEISVDGLAGSTLGAVTGVVASTAGA